MREGTKLASDMRTTKKLAIIGAGNAACITALHFCRYGQGIFDKITIYHDPSMPIERVGQGSTLTIPDLIFDVLGVNWYNQDSLLRGTRKDGILYENWGTKTEKFIHAFPLSSCSIHYVPKLLSELVLNSGLFDVVTQNIQDPEKEIDADFIFDCRGRHNRNESLYVPLVNPLNAVLLGRTETPDPELHYTRCVATPDGWTFVIPNHDSVSYGYLYNKDITEKEQASKNFTEMFDVYPDEGLTFQNYIAKSFFEGERTILNGNRSSFLEPLEATSVGFYQKVCRFSYDHIVQGSPKDICNQGMRTEMLNIQNFILWHYQFGSKFDTPFWDYAKSLRFSPDPAFNAMVEKAKNNPMAMDTTDYAQWGHHAFRTWVTNV